VGIVIGQMLGAKQYAQAKRDSIRLMWFTGLLTASVSLVLIALSGFFPRVYDTTDEVRHLATRFIIITALFFPVQGFLNALYYTLRSGGKTVITFLFDSVYSCVVTVPVTFLLCRYSAVPILVVYAIVQALDFIKVCVGYVLIQKGVWITNLVES
jgi:Na+-driven multidrug efflux pump